MIEDSQLQQLITALGEDFELTGEEIADVLWLAAQRLKYNNNTVTEIPITKPEVTEPEVKPWWSKLKDSIAKIIFFITPIANSARQKQPAAASSIQFPATAIYKEPTVPLYPEAPSSVTNYPSKALPIRIPDAPSLREPLQLAQSLRALMRRIASDRKVILDEIATAKRIAEHKIYLPVLKSETEPWLDLALVIDESQSMAIWRHTIEDLKRLVQNYGIFRDVRIWGLVTDETGEVKLLPRIGTKKKEQRFANPRELIDPNGRRLILVVSDCVSRLWYDGAIIPPLQAWTQRQPLAILQMLPDWLWLRTGLGNGASVLFKSLAPGVANQKLEVEELLLRKDFDLSEGIKIPVLTLEPDLAYLWSEMVSGKSEAVISGFVLPPQIESDEESLLETEVAQLDAAGRITRFRQTASPIARKLAGLLAAAPVINLPVVRLIQDTLLAQSNQVHVAEVFLGGLLKPLIVIEADTNLDTVQYDFMDDGIRQIFLKDAPVSDSAEVFDAVSQYVAQKLNKSLQEFVALLKAPQEAEEKQREDTIKPFADIAASILRNLGGQYAEVADEIDPAIKSEREYAQFANKSQPRKFLIGKRLIVCCDGTWQSQDNEVPTNVSKIAQAVKQIGKPNKIPQVRYYDQNEGNNSTFDVMTNVIKNVMKRRNYLQWIDEKIIDAYRFLCLNYEPGDEIYLFGFSQGAYIVRSLAGLISRSGLLKPPDINKTTEAYRIYRIGGQPEREQKAREFRQYNNIREPVSIKFLGCWDTVGALGVPYLTPMLPISRFFNVKYQFYDIQLSSIIENARHAIAIDEKTPGFEVTPMIPGPDFAGTLKQVWFPGTHACVGGGEAATLGLSNAALKWMANEASELGLDLDLSLAENTEIIDYKTPFKSKSILAPFGRRERDITTLNDQLPDESKFDLNNSFHDSVKQRWCDPDMNYRPRNLEEFIGNKPHNWCS